MRYIEDLITASRRLSNNDNFTTDGTGVTTSGISDNEVLQYLNDAQDRIQSLISASNPQTRPFVVDRYISIVANQQDYAIPDRVFFNKEIEQVEYSHSGLLEHYTLLRKVDLFNNSTASSSYVSGYYRMFGRIFLVGIPSTSSGKLRVKYERSMDDLDKRRGTITAVTVSAAGVVTALTISAASDDAVAIAAQKDKYLCVCNADGTVKAYNVPFTAYNDVSGAFTLATYTPLQSTETAAVGDYITLGKFTVTHSELPDEMEGYLIHYGAKELLRRGASTEFTNQSELVSEMESAIVKQMRSQTAELNYIPQLDFNEWW